MKSIQETFRGFFKRRSLSEKYMIGSLVCVNAGLVVLLARLGAEIASPGTSLKHLDITNQSIAENHRP